MLSASTLASSVKLKGKDDEAVQNLKKEPPSNRRFRYLFCLAVLANQAGLRSPVVGRSALLDFDRALVGRFLQLAIKLD